ncbi:MAG: serine/threonine-protein kinase [Planctomycetota bacterium]
MPEPPAHASPYSRLADDDQAALSVILEGFEQRAKRGGESALAAILDVAPERMREALLCESLPVLIAEHRGRTGLTPTLHQLRLMNPGLRSEIAEVYPWLPPSLRLPTEIGGYRVVASIGEGAQSVVLKGQDDVHRAVAIKLSASARHNDLLARERDTLAGCNHRGVVSVVASGNHHDRAYLVMPLLEGETLADRFKTRRASPREAAGIGEQVAAAVAHLHRNGVLHRDIKPANVWIDADDQVTLIDLGMALPAYRFGEPLPPLGEFSGTPAFMAPEQARAEPDADGKLTDLFAVGGVLCWLLTGVGPFPAGSSREAIERAAAGRLDRPMMEKLQDAPDALRRVCLEAIEVDPAKRPASAALMAERLAGTHARLRRREAAALRPWYASPLAASVLLGALIAGVAYALPRADQPTTVYRPVLPDAPEAWVPEVAEAQGIELDHVTAGDFHLQIASPERVHEVAPLAPDATQAAGVLTVRVAPHLTDLAESLSYRIGARRWRPLPYGSGGGARSALLDERDLEVDAPVEVRLGGADATGVTAGPFAYSLVARQAVERDRYAFVKSHYDAAKSDDWLRPNHHRWEVRREFVERHAGVLSAIHFGEVVEQMTQHASLKSPEDIAMLAKSAEIGYQRWFGGLQNSAVLWTQLEFSDGSRSEPRVYYRKNRYGIGGSAEPARERLASLLATTPMARFRESRFVPIGLAQIDLALTAIEVGPRKDQLALSLPITPLRRGGKMKPIPTDRITARNESLLNPDVKHRLKQQEPELVTDNGAAISAASLPPLWPGVYFRGCYRDGTTTPVYFAKNELPRQGFTAELVETSPGGEQVQAYVYAFPPYSSPHPGVGTATLLEADAWLHTQLPEGAARVAYFSDAQLSQPLHKLFPGLVYARFANAKGQVLSACAYRVHAQPYAALIKAASP